MKSVKEGAAHVSKSSAVGNRAHVKDALRVDYDDLHFRTH